MERKLANCGCSLKVLGTNFGEKDGKFENRVDVNRVKEFMQVVHAV
ncbi:MAG: hypothetical protein ACLUJR_05695 [Mediterraneibacter gnavus]